MKTYVAVALLAGFLAAMPVRAENPYPTSLGGPETTFGMASEFNHLFAILSDEALRDIMCRLSGARFTPGRLSAALGMPEGQVLRRINTLRGWGLVRMVRHDSATTIVEPMPGEGSQTLRRWANRYCSEGDACGRPVANADSQGKSANNRGRQGDGRMVIPVASGGMAPQGSGGFSQGEENAAASGTVLWFSWDKGYGFIRPDDGSQDVFVHRSAVQRAGLFDLRENQKVTYDMVPDNRGRTSAENLVITGSDEPNSQLNERKQSDASLGGGKQLFGKKSALSGDGKPSSGMVERPVVTDISFSELGLALPIQRALATRDHIHPTPIQAKAIPKLLAGDDVMGIAQTGTGKTAAFALPILHQLSLSGQGNVPHRPRALILAPTRELAIQIGEEFRAYGKHLSLRHAVIYGGVGQRPQVSALERGADIVIATPGRLLDLMDQGWIGLRDVKFLVLDEADRMLDMGFVPDIREIISFLPKVYQSLMFSATMPREIARLSDEILVDPVRIEVAPQATPVENLEQTVYHVKSTGKAELLTKLLGNRALSRVLVFARTKRRVDNVTYWLKRSGIRAEAIHSNKTQNARQRALQHFRDGGVRVLVATDIAARGIDVDGITHVINYDLPDEPENYVHRIGRTARAGAGGEAISFCDPFERNNLLDIERLIGFQVDVIGDEPMTAPPNRRYGRNSYHRNSWNRRPWRHRRRKHKQTHLPYRKRVSGGRSG